MHTAGQIPQLRHVDVKLVVRYTGIKATQYFTKFTDESVDIFRKDLFTLKLPLPKKDNVSLLSHGCVEAKWFAVPSKGVFHQQILTKSDISQQMREQLSIETIAARTTLRPLVQPENFQKPGAKSWLADIAGPSTATPSKKVFVLSRDAVSNWTKDLVHGRDPWAANAQERPHKKAKLDHEDASSSETQESSAFPTFTNLPPLEPRNQGSTNIRLFVQSMPKNSARAMETSQGQEQPSSVNSRADKNDFEMSKEFQNQDNAPGSSATNTPRFRVKQEPNDNDDSLLLQSKATEQNNVHTDRLPIPDHSTFQTTTPTTHEPTKSIKSENQTDDLAATHFLASLKLNVDTQTQERTSEPRTHQDSQMPIWPPSQHSPSRVNPLEFTNNPPPSNFYQRSNWYQDSEVPPFRGPAAETMRSAGSLTRPSTSRQASTPSLSSWEGSVVPPVEDQASRNNNFTSTTQSEDIDMSYRHRSSQNREGHRAASQRLQRELFDIKREISANVAREAAVIAQLKELKVSSIPAPVKIGHDPSEEMKDDLARLEHELAAERKLREEAEAVIADMRREMKAPFVVPSLFDAFVQLSRLTTQGLRAGAASSSSEPKDEVMNGVTSEHKVNEPADISMSPKE